jgi:hypothetical protein
MRENTVVVDGRPRHAVIWFDLQAVYMEIVVKAAIVVLGRPGT